MFKLFAPRQRAVEADTPKQNFLRIVILTTVFTLTIFGFWLNYQRQETLLTNRLEESKLTPYFTKEELNSIEKMQVAFKKKFSLKLIIDIQENESINLPKLDNMMIYIGVSLKDKSVLIDLPPWLVKLIDLNFIKDTETELQKSLNNKDQDAWRKKLGETVLILGQKIETIMER
ncbi:hypothetical protein [Desulfovibrio litoralis]|uniref:Uncharacterized protein n=1 Tax=Desulfovibrio litoralis DSM 11393 TaxID=1121455 RepID=A0A1M7SAV5_9BACT|nr:hypothetical protein [Desulfovibrio litoralis]SHN55626.1 hypothetical protein SAMN02745728_00698 [Desulfovibrio litoralis DSM 11393]